MNTAMRFEKNTGGSIKSTVGRRTLIDRRSPYALLLLVFAVSRVAYYLLGVRFDDRGLTWFFQFLDMDLLQHRLFQSLFYLHHQPPGYNLFLGIILKLFPAHHTAAFHTIHLMFGAAVSCMLFFLMRKLGVGVRISFPAASLFAVSPGVVLYENFILYEYQQLFVLAAGGAFLCCFCVRRNWLSASGFLACQFWLVMIRNYYNLIYLAVIFVLLLCFIKYKRKLFALFGSLLLAVVFGVYLKNLVLFGHFTGSTWLGMNMAFITYQLTPEERKHLLATHEISPVSAVPTLGAHLSAYRSSIAVPAPSGVPALDMEKKLSGAINYNHPGFLEVGKYYKRDALYIVRHYPSVYLRAVVIAWFAYFLPPGDNTFFHMNMPHIRKIERFFDVVFFGQFRDAWDRKEIRRIKARGDGASLLFHTGLFLLVGLPALLIFGVRHLFVGIRQRTLDVSSAALLGYMLFNIVYVTAVCNFMSTIENNRYRFPLDGFYLVLAALALERIWRKIKGRRSPARCFKITPR